jgi:DNA-binding CsgD family transcriptional regulator
MLVGREAERAEIDALLEDARRGRSRVLVYTGTAGIGKSALLEYAREHAVGMRILAVAGIESESDLPFGAVHALLRPVLGAIDHLPERQRESLSVALALSEGDEPDRLAAYAGVLTLLADVASEQPLLLVIDDAHWLDVESAAALAFVARRVAGEELAFLAAIRDGEASTFEHGSLPNRALSPLSESESRELLRIRHGDLVKPEATTAVVAVGGGNPLALVELPCTLTAEQLAGLAPLEEPLPLAERIETSFLRRTAQLPDETRQALLVAAAGADLPVSAIREAGAALGASELAPAESAGLVRVDGGTVRFVHPLLRSAIYQAAPSDERRRAHRALAAALAEEPDLQAWQLAAAADEPSEEVAAALEAAADRAVARGGHAARARALERASDLSPGPDDRARRLVAAAQAAFWSGDTTHALALCERTLTIVDDPLIRADLVHQYATAAAWLEHPPTLPDLEVEAARVDELDADRACKLLVTHATHLYSRLECSSLLGVAGRLEKLVDRLGPWWQPRARVIVADARMATGATAAAHDLYDELVATDPIAIATTASLVFVERYEDAQRVLTEALEYGRTEGNVVRVAYSQTVLALLELALGRLEPARTPASHGLELARGARLDYFVAINLLTLATIDAVQGRQSSCRERVAEASAKAPDRGYDDLRLKARVTLGLLESSQGRYDDVVRELEPVHERVRRSGLHEPSLFPYQPDLVEAYVRLGRLDEAVALLDWFEGQAENADRRWALAAAARCRGLLAQPSDVDATFAHALERHDDVPSAFERARTELLYGERLRRANRRRDARAHLRTALETFDEHGAEPWSERAHSELRATGERVPTRSRDEREQLTPQELQIATLVAEGLTNREIGAQIFLSPKTVEYHLTHVYRKLDLHSRAELIRHLATERPSPEATRV